MSAVSQRPTARAMIEAEIERLIAYLDALDGDPDLEANLAGCATLPLPDLEIDVVDNELDDADGEPSLGSLECLDQRRWNAGDASDLEVGRLGRAMRAVKRESAALADANARMTDTLARLRCREITINPLNLMVAT